MVDGEDCAGSKLKGVIHIHAETGTEGGLWAFQEDKHIEPPAIGQRWPKWSYDGLHILDNGDYLTVYSPSRDAVLWEGMITLVPQDRNKPLDDLILVGAIIMRTLPPEEVLIHWQRWFQHEFPADLQKCL